MPNQFPEIYTQFLANVLIAFILIGFIVTILLLYQKRKLVQEKEVEAMHAEFEKTLLKTKLEIQEEVLKEISLEIHDNVGQIMLLANVNLSIIQSMKMPADVKESIKEVKQILGKAIDDVSQLSRSLNSDRIIDIGVFGAIKHELELLSKKGVFIVTISGEVEKDIPQLSNDVQLIVFRMFQEILSNIIKHSKAKTITFQLNAAGNGIEMQIADDGIGFHKDLLFSERRSINGVGMRNLHSRALSIGGKATIESDMDKGTTIAVYIPVKSDKQF